MDLKERREEFCKDLEGGKGEGDDIIILSQNTN